MVFSMGLVEKRQTWGLSPQKLMLACDRTVVYV